MKGIQLNNLELYLDTLAKLKETNYSELAKNLEKLAEELLYEKATSDSKDDKDSAETSDSEDAKAIDISGEESQTVLVFNQRKICLI